jgi:N-methylhydantoinase A
MSAAGAMRSDVTREFSLTHHTSTTAFDRAGTNAALGSLTVQARDFAVQGSVEYIAEARYVGQAWDIDVPLPTATFRDDADVAAFRAAFDAMHEQLFTIRDEASAVELIGLRARVRHPVRPDVDFTLARAGVVEDAGRSRPVYFSGQGWVETPVRRWDAIASGIAEQGPALIESPFTTVVVDPAARYQRSAGGALLIEAL